MVLLYDQDTVDENIAGKTKTDDLARERVVALFDYYKSIRDYTQGGQEVSIIDEWDENYRLYKTIFNKTDHNYDGVAEAFIPIVRQAINVIESEASNALFSRDDYFSVEAVGETNIDNNFERETFNVLKYYSDKENYVDNFELAIKQAIIYGCTAGEVVFTREEYKDKVKRMIEEQKVDEVTGEPLFAQDSKTGQRIPVTQKRVVVEDVTTIVERPRVEVRDIYRLYINHNSNTPMDEDVIYRDSMSADKLMRMADSGVYNKKAVKELLESPSEQISGEEITGDGQTLIDEMVNEESKINRKYEVLRFQGLFSADGKNYEQYLIDIGERKHVLRVQRNPFYGEYKTFIFTNYDTMLNEAYSDGVSAPIKSMQYEINDKENQSLDAVSFQNGAPWLVSNRSKIKKADIVASRKKPNYAIRTNDMDGMKKLIDQVNVSHINSEIQRLTGMASLVTGANSIMSGNPTGTQADRSGTALGILQTQGKSQFSKFIRKFERQFIKQGLSKSLKLILQFSNDEVPMHIIQDDTNDELFKNFPVPMIVGEYEIKVDSGSQYIKERDIRDSILEFLSIASINDAFINTLDIVTMFKDIGRRMPYDMSKYVNPENLYNQQRMQIEQLTGMLQNAGEGLKNAGEEIKRLQGVVKQTDRAQEASPPVETLEGE